MELESLLHTFACGVAGIDVVVEPDGSRHAVLWTTDGNGCEQYACEFPNGSLHEFADAVQDARKLLDVLAKHPSSITRGYLAWLDDRGMSNRYSDEQSEKLRSNLRMRLTGR